MPCARHLLNHRCRRPVGRRPAGGPPGTGLGAISMRRISFRRPPAREDDEVGSTGGGRDAGSLWVEPAPAGQKVAGPPLLLLDGPTLPTAAAGVAALVESAR